MTKRLIIDLDRCDDCSNCGVQCSYIYRPHASDHGVLAIRERATYHLICRRCEAPSCVLACPFEALERREDGVLERHNLRCVSCKLCAHACPFGTIFPDLLSFYVTPCNYCLDQHQAPPPCVTSCRRGALEYREVDPAEAGVHVLDEHLAARTPKWQKQAGSS